MKNMKNEGHRSIWMAAWLALAAFIVALVAGGHSGPGLNDVSLDYLQVARNLVRGHGFSLFSPSGSLEGMTVHPPLYPFFLSVGNFLGMDFPTWGVRLNALLWAGNVFLMTMAAFYLTGRRRSALLTGLLALLSVCMAEAHVSILAQPLFLVFTLASLWMLTVYCSTKTTWHLLAAALLAAFAALTSYAGVLLILSALGVLALRREKFYYGLLYFLVSSLLPLFWLVRCCLIDGGIAGRQIAVYRFSLDKLANIPDALSVYLLPAFVPWPLRWLVLGVFLAFLAYMFLRPRAIELIRVENPRFFAAGQVFGVFSFLYLMGLLAAGFFWDEKFLVTWKEVLPVCVLLMIVAPLLLDHQQLKSSGKRLRGFSALFVVVLLATGFLRTASLVKDMLRGQYRKSVVANAKTGIAETVRSLADNVPVYTNDISRFYYFAGRPAIKIPSAGENISYLLPMERVREDFLVRRAVAVIFGTRGGEHSEWIALCDVLPLSVLFGDVSGEVLGYRSKPVVSAAP